jgi:hypothetical protein
MSNYTSRLKRHVMGDVSCWVNGDRVEIMNTAIHELLEAARELQEERTEVLKRTHPGKHPNKARLLTSIQLEKK